jgi:hypothetical protein
MNGSETPRVPPTRCSCLAATGRKFFSKRQPLLVVKDAWNHLITASFVLLFFIEPFGV